MLEKDGKKKRMNIDEIQEVISMSWSFPSLANVPVTISGHDDLVTEVLEAEKLKEGKKPIRSVLGGYASQGYPLDSETGVLSPILIRWQNGPVKRSKTEHGNLLVENLNGAFVEDVLNICVKRLEAYQRSSFACKENAEAIAAVDAAIEILVKRRGARRERGVEGKNEV